MKKNVILFVFLFFSLILFAQSNTKHIEIKWTGNSLNRTTLYFEGAKLLDPSGLIPSYTIEVSLKENQSLSSIQISNITEESYVSDSLFYENALQFLSKEYAPSYYIKRNDKESKAIIHFAAVKNNPLPYVVDKLISFDISYNIIDGREKTADNNYPSSPQQMTPQAFETESAMANGRWYQFKLNKSGVYKLTYEQIKKIAGININGVSSSQIKMYGFGGMLPEFNNTFRHPDIPEIAIKMVDGNDGTFSSGDYILFYAEGPDTWTFYEKDNSNIEDVFHHHINVYSRESYYYLVISEGEGKRIESTNSITGANYTVNTFNDYAFVEDELYSLTNSGRRWLGDKYEFTTEYTYNFDFENLKIGSPIYCKTVAVARSSIRSMFSVKALNQSRNLSIDALSTGDHVPFAKSNELSWEIPNSSSNHAIDITLEYNQPLSGSIGWLDYIEVNVIRDLIFNSKQISFRNIKSVQQNRITKFELQNPNSNNIEIWNISEKTAPSSIQYSTSGSTLSYSLETNTLLEFVAFDASNCLQAEFTREIENQNLHAELSHDYIIITHPRFLEQAEELAQFHRDYSHLNVYVTTLEPIYHEFSSGKQDISAIRDFLRAIYTNSNHKLKYVLLFGDASMDYLDRVDNNTNMVPTWESVNSLHPIYSLATDDYIACLDPNEGDFVYDEVDIGVGRFPVVTATEAQEMVDKVIHYKSNTPKVMADWRNTICFIADDEDSSSHLNQANNLSILVDTIYPTANLDKIFVDAYQQESSPAGQRYPKVNQAINERVNKGALIISYTGHGGEVGWGQERFLDVPDILSWRNIDNLPVFLTATCEFARYDDPKRVSAGELVFLNSKGGGISLFTTSRLTYSYSNFTISTNFYKTALKKVHGEYPKMGDIIKKTKTLSGSSLNVQKFILLGDPALSLNMPEFKINISSIENTNTGEETDTIFALSSITIVGNISDENNNILSDFDGFVYPTVYDKPTEVTTLGNDPSSPPYVFDLQKNILYKGKATVANGEFKFSFIAPKDIAYKYGKGKISLYAENLDIDATGYYDDVIIGGFDENNTENDEGPKIELYINDKNFISGGITNENPILLAFVSDDQGINTTGNGIGHDISATLDGNENNMKVLNDYYVADANSYKSGAITFPYFNLADGSHTIELKVWDIHNNSNKASIDFIVASSANMALDHLFNYPNPLLNSTTFSFEHNQANEDLDIIIDIYGIDGKFATRLEKHFTASGYRTSEIKWDATDQNGSKISKGIYIYRVNVKTSSGKESNITSKLVVIK